MAAECHRLSLSRKRKRNSCSRSPRVEVVDVGEDLDSVSDCNQCEQCSSPRQGYAERAEDTTLPRRTVLCERVDCELACCSTNSDGEKSLIKEKDYCVDDFEIYSQDWRVWNPQNVSESSLLSKKQTKLHSFFEYAPATERNLHPTPVTTNAMACSRRRDEMQNLLKSDGHKIVQLEKSQDLEPTETSSDNGVSVKPCAISLDASNHSVRCGDSQLFKSSSSQQFDGIQSSSITSAKRRVCPQHKWIPGTGFTVDAFSYGAVPGCTAFFLTHFHSDHYQGLGKRWDRPIYCSQVTANLVAKRLQVHPTFLHPLPLNTPSSVNGVNVVLVDANHCPGSVMFLFKLPNGTNHLHTGDFRASKEMEEHKFLHDIHIHTLFLDTTYCKPCYNFPCQKEAIVFCVSCATESVLADPSTLIICGTYCIGKEKIFLAIAEALKCQAYVSSDKERVLACLESEHISGLVTSSHPTNTPLHVLPLNRLTFNELQEYLQTFSGGYSRVVAFKPTGWTHRSGSSGLNGIKPSTRGRVSIFGIPYSEHSSYSEMRNFVQFLRPDKVVSTVGGEKVRRESETHCHKWLAKKAGTGATIENKLSQATLNQMMASLS